MTIIESSRFSCEKLLQVDFFASKRSYQITHVKWLNKRTVDKVISLRDINDRLWLSGVKVEADQFHVVFLRKHFLEIRWK